VENYLVRWSVRVAMLLYVFALARGLQRGREPGENDRPGRYTWTLGCLVFLVHVAAAFHFQHQWSHQLAIQHTAQEAERVFGWAFGEGIYFSYAFTLFWFLDVVWMWFNGEGRRQRARWIPVVLHVFLLTIAINGAIIFATGPVRWVGLLMLGVLAYCWFSGRSNPRQVSQRADS
tara:strand:- start:183 stop:707 length:525 start_codon:yes stop_codon:yes gene_type:complete